MRICIISQELQGVTEYTGGIGTHFRAVAQELARLGHDIVVLTGPAPADRLDAIRAPRLSAVPCVSESLGTRFAPLDVAGWPRSVASAVRRYGRFDVIFAPEWGGWASMCSGGQPEIPIVTNLTTSLAQIRAIEPKPDLSPRYKLRDALQTALERRQVLRSAGLVGISDALLQWTRRIWPIAGIPCSVVPNFLDIELVRKLGQRQLETSMDLTDRPLVVFTGRLCRWKGVDVLGKAMLGVWQDFPDSVVAFVGRVDRIGDRPADVILRDLAGRGHEKQLLFLGHQPPEVVLPLVARSDVAVFPSLFEGFGMGALEARVLGRPVVATRGGGFSDFCRDGMDSLLTDPGSVSQLETAIKVLLQSSELRQRFGAEAARDAGRFSAVEVVPRLLSCLERAAGSVSNVRG